MVRIALFLASFFGSVFTWVSAWLTSKVGLVVAVGAVSLATMAALFVALKVLIGYLIVPAMVNPAAEPFVMAFFAVWPSNAETCVSIIFSTDVAIFLYKYKTRLIALVS